jgi:hypothetical protein
MLPLKLPEDKNEVDVDPKGTLTLKTMQAVQINDKAVNTGKITYNRAVTGLKRKIMFTGLLGRRSKTG